LNYFSVKTIREIDHKGKYTITIGGLSEGVHSYSFVMGDDFFACYQNPEIFGGNVQAQATLVKNFQNIVIEIQFSGAIKIQCDFCLDAFDYLINHTEQLLFSNGRPNAGEKEEDVIVLSEGENQIDLSQDLYELVALRIPMKKMHPTDEKGNATCDPQMLELLKKYIVE